MKIRCKHCDYDRTGIPRRSRCPECGGKRQYLDRPFDWQRFRRWPGLLAPAGLLVSVIGAGLLVSVRFGLPISTLLGVMVAVEGLLVGTLAFVNWR